jgi:hypothetical protein
VADNLSTVITGDIHAQAVDLLRFEAAERARVLKLLSTLENDLIDKINRNIGKSELTTQRLETLLAQTKDTIASAYGDITDTHLDQLGKVSQASAYSIADSMNNAVGVDVASVAFTPGQLRSLADETYFMGRHVEEWWSGAGDKLYDNFTTEMRVGMLQGEGVPQLTQRVLGTKENNYADGLMNTPRYQAEALVRTATVGAANAGRLATMTDNADLLNGVQWVATLDDRVCPICMALDGLAWELPEDGDAENYGGYVPIDHSQDYPGATVHVNCRCAQIPVMKSLEQLQDDDAISEEDATAIDEETRASMDGETSDTNFDDWLNSKPPEFQNDLLGQEKAELFRQGKIEVGDLIDQSNRPLTAEQLLAKTDTTVERMGVRGEELRAGQRMNFQVNPNIADVDARIAYDEIAEEARAYINANNAYASKYATTRITSADLDALKLARDTYRLQTLPQIRADVLMVDKPSIKLPKIKAMASASPATTLEAEQAAMNLRSITDKSLFDKMRLQVKLEERKTLKAGGGKSAANAQYDAYSGRMTISREYMAEADVFDRQSTMMHEWMHKMMHDTGLWERELEFYNARGGESFKWMDNYMGKKYNPMLGKKSPGVLREWEPREVMTVAVQYYWFAPEVLASRDPELFEFVYKMLNGKIKPPVPAPFVSQPITLSSLGMEPIKVPVPAAVAEEAAAVPKLGKLASRYTEIGGTEARIVEDLFDRKAVDRLANIAQEFDLNTVTQKMADKAAQEVQAYTQHYLQYVRKLPEEFTVWRAGAHSGDVTGVTLDRAVAERNAKRFGTKMVEYTVKRSDVLADIEALRPEAFQEKELLVHPEKLIVKPTTPPATTVVAEEAEESPLLTKKISSTSENSPGAKGANGSYEITYEDGNKALFKPVELEDDALQANVRGVDENPNTMAHRDAATSGVARIVKMDDLVPETVMTEMEIEGATYEGSLQQWAFGSKNAYSFPEESGMRFGKVSGDVERSAAWDWFTGNLDRHGNNWMVNEATGKMTLIDNGMTFSQDVVDFSSRLFTKASMDGLKIPGEVHEWFNKWPEINTYLEKAGFTNVERSAAFDRLRMLDEFDTFKELNRSAEYKEMLVL